MSFNETNENQISFHHILRITYPIILSTFSLNIMLFIDRAFVAKCDLTQFAATMPAGIFAMTVGGLLLGVVGYVSVLVSQYYGAGKYQECSLSMWQGIYLSTVFALILLGLLPLIANTFQIMGHSGELLIYEKQFFYLIMFSNCIQLFTLTFSSFHSGIGDTKTPMLVSIIGNLVNIVLDYVLIFGKLGFPQLGGIWGAGLATFFSNVVCLLSYILLLTKKKLKLQFGILTNYRFDKKLTQRLFKFGVPAAIQGFFGQASYSILLLIIGITGELNMTCANIAFTIEGLSVFPVYGLAAAVGIIAGQERGAGRVDNISKVLKRGILIGFFYNFVLIFLYNFFPDLLVSIFDNGKESARFLLVKNTTIPLVKFMSIWLAIDTIVILTSGVLRSVGDTLFMMVLYIIVPTLFYIPPAYFICVIAKLPLIWLWVILLLFTICMVILVSKRFISGKWRQISVIESK